MNHTVMFLLVAVLSLPLMAQGPGGGGGGGGGGNPLEALEPPPQPAGNPLTDAKANLGKALFWDEQLSSTNTVACGTCHQAGAGGADPRNLVLDPEVHPGPDGQYGTDDDVVGSLGVSMNYADGSYDWEATFGILPQLTGRNTPAFTDAAYSDTLFWDGRADDQLVDPISGAVLLNSGAALEVQALGPPTSSAEMGHVDRDWIQIVDKMTTARPLILASDVPTALADWLGDRNYPQLFEEAFGDSEVTAGRIAMAIASYERTLFSDQTRLDAFLNGTGTLTPQENQGRQVFNQADCIRCHGGQTLSDDEFHYIGVRPNNEDPGRFTVTGDNGDMGAMRTPGLRNVALRAPHMRNGSLATLMDVVDFYDRGGDFDAPNKSNLIRELNLNQGQKDALVAFLSGALTDPRVEAELPPFDKPTLYAESDRVPVIESDGVPGTDGFMPMPLALEPPFAGNTSFTVALDNSLGGADALLVIDSADPGTAANFPESGSFAYESVLLDGIGSGAGYGSVSLNIPVIMAETTLFGRWYVADSGAVGGVAISPLIRFNVFGGTDEIADCSGDLDGSGRTRILDLVNLTNQIGCSGDCSGDVDQDGHVTLADLNLVLPDWVNCN